MIVARDVIVVGGGFSGAMTAAHLARRGLAPVVIEPGALGRGRAYAPSAAPLLLNTPAAAMSALPDDPTHFVRYLERRDPASPTFAPRAVYGDYLAATIDELARGRLHVARTRATALAVDGTRATVTCADGARYAAPAFVLALGHAPPAAPRALGDTHPASYLADPYRAFAHATADDPVLIVGSGLTALDVIAGLHAHGHTGRILVVSRRGLLPVAHELSRPIVPVVVPRDLVRSPRLQSLLGWWRAQRERRVAPRSSPACARSCRCCGGGCPSPIARRSYATSGHTGTSCAIARHLSCGASSTSNAHAAAST